jgi:hypothetical protein
MPMLKTLDFLREPRDKVYRDLVLDVSKIADRAILVIPPSFVQMGFSLSDAAKDVLRKLEPWCRVMEKRAEWPGTRQLGGALGQVQEYAISPQIVSILQTSVSGLYEWIAPGAPEDLSFIRADGSALLTVVAHEGEAWLSLDSGEEELLRPSDGSLRDYVVPRV